jgi:hypothetical protein
MSEARFSEIETLIDRALATAAAKSVLDFDKHTSAEDESHRILIDSMWSCARDETDLDSVRANFKVWLEALKVTAAQATIAGEPMAGYTQLRKCFSIGCLGLVQFSRGSGECSFCGLHQVVVRLDPRHREELCTYSISSTSDPEPSKVVSLAMRKKQKASGSDKKVSGMSLF